MNSFRGYDLLPHQVRAVTFAENRKFSLLNYWVGTGKTLIGGKLLSMYKNPVLIRMTSHKDAWKDMFERTDRTFSHSLSSKNIHEKFLSLSDCGIIVVDEAHKFKSLDAKSTRVLHEFLIKNPYAKLVFMTGTPVTRSLEDFASYFLLAGHLNKNIPAIQNKWDFNYRWLESSTRQIRARGKTLNLTEWGSLKKDKKDEFIQQLNTFMLSQDGKILELPSKIFTNRYFNGNKEPLYRSFIESKPSERDIDPSILERADKLHQDIKAKKYKDHDKVIVLTKFLPTVDALIKSDKFFPVGIHGGTSDREKVIEDFKRSDYKFIVGTYKTLGVGFNMQFSDAMVLFDIPYTPSDLAQGLGRISRKGQTRICHFYSYLFKAYDKRTVRKLMERDESFGDVGVGYVDEYLRAL